MSDFHPIRSLDLQHPGNRRASDSVSPTCVDSCLFYLRVAQGSVSVKHFAPLLLLLTAAAEPAPNSQVDWRWVPATPMCSLRQAYSPGGNVVMVSRAPGNDQSTIFIGGREPILASAKTLRGARLKFLPDGESAAEVSVTEAKGRRDIFALSNDPAFLSKFAKASAIELAQEEVGTIRVPLRSSPAAIEALRSCEDGRMRDWDPVAWRALKSRPLPATAWTDWIGPNDYPIDALLSGSQGFMVLRFEIGPDGSVRDCRRLVRGRPVQQRLRLCSKLKRLARFKPAVASSGENVAAPFVLVINFRLA